MTHTVDLSDLNDFVIKTLIASSSEDRKRLFAVTHVIENRVSYTLVQSGKELMTEIDNIRSAINMYNEL